MIDELKMMRQILADKCVAVIGAEIDAIAITFDKGLFKKEIFTKMKSLASMTSNTLLTDVVIFAANAHAIAGHFDESRKMLEAARCKAVHIGLCRELVFMFYIEVQLKLHKFERTPTVDERQAISLLGRMGLECVEQDGNKTWRRSFVLRMVFCLLDLGNKANVIENCPVDEACIVEAKELLADIDRNWTEARRKMLYYIARGRIAELTKQYQDCLMETLTHQKIQHTAITSRRETDTEGLDDMEDDSRNNLLIKSSSFNQSPDISIRSFNDDGTIPKQRRISPVASNKTSNLSVRLSFSGRTSSGNSDEDSFMKPIWLDSSEHPYPTQEH
ncbi:LOW QUALITY PROTEIN: hypothetical protein MAR_023598 [Mya arenaria]|uniref:Uncharacterized protein n=1 Tax=Mya arenaria TaxID=6604 RepID=A0ABY7DRB9_MYAAR|nr:LOW QUALITY PROTEIN: hypothetical protein MAR_023598 [Mya arenaria]